RLRIGELQIDDLVGDDWLRLKRSGFSDADIGAACGVDEEVARAKRRWWGVRPVYRRVDSCAGEVEAGSNYLYSTWGEADESPTARGHRRSVVILGSGPNRIGQGIEFDYCCVHAAQSFRALGYEAVMVNCNPETVSTDYDTSDRLYFEPLGVEEVLAVCEREQPEGVVIQFGGQTPLKLARAIEAAGFRILGTPFEAVDLAEDRERFAALCDGLGIEVPAWGMAEGAEAAVHSGDSSCVLPATSLTGTEQEQVVGVVECLGPALGVVGLLNAQLALADGRLFVLEANPRASRTVPFVSKATGVNLVQAASRLAAGASLSNLALPRGQSQGQSQ